MSRYILIHRLRGPAFLLLVGVLALLNQADILGWGQSWPLFMILAGVLLLAERAALAVDGPPAPYQSGPYAAGAVNPAAPGASRPQAGSSIVPAGTQDFGNGPQGGER